MNTFHNTKDLTDLDDATMHQYRDLIHLVKMQREKITMQQVDLNKYDAEIVYLENKERDAIQHIEAITREIEKTDQIYRQGNEQVRFKICIIFLKL